MHWVVAMRCARQFSKTLSVKMLVAVGRSMALLHRHGREWSPPKGWARDRLDVTWLHGAPNPIASLPLQYQRVVGEAHDRLGPILTALCAQTSHVLHADLLKATIALIPAATWVLSILTIALLGTQLRTSPSRSTILRSILIKMSYSVHFAKAAKNLSRGLSIRRRSRLSWYGVL